MNPRYAALLAITEVLQNGRNLPDALEYHLSQLDDRRDRALAQAIAYGVIRQYLRLRGVLEHLMDKLPRKKDYDVFSALLIGLYQIIYMRIPDHAAVTETVSLVKRLRKSWARGMVNGVLRNFLRQQSELLSAIESTPASHYAHPDWLLDYLQSDWPDQWLEMVEANNMAAPMTLRVNQKNLTRDSYVQTLKQNGINANLAAYTDNGLILEQPMDVAMLPGFSLGNVSVQDAAAQLAAPLLDPQPGDRVLDACAAPGGKTSHLLEYQTDISEIIALDIDSNRLEKISENLNRLKLNAQCLSGDASDLNSWWDGQPFNRILLDAPCSATGVIRRHPDIKLLRTNDDISHLLQAQQAILEALWQTLVSGGFLLYATCSILKEENTKQIESFLAQHADAIHHPIDAQWGIEMPAGRQILPGDNNMDGFFYARIQKA